MKRVLFAAVVLLALSLGVAGGSAQAPDIPQGGEIRWLRDADGSVIGRMFANTGSENVAEFLDLRTVDPESGRIAGFRAEAFDSDRSTGTARAMGIAFGDTHGHSRTIIDSLGRSQFLQLDNVYDWRAEQYALSYNPPRLGRFSGRRASLFAEGVEAGDFIVFLGSSGFQSPKLNISAEGVASKSGSIKLAVFNMDNRAFNAPRKTYRFLVIHRD